MRTQQFFCVCSRKVHGKITWLYFILLLYSFFNGLDLKRVGHGIKNEGAQDGVLIVATRGQDSLRWFLWSESEVHRKFTVFQSKWLKHTCHIWPDTSVRGSKLTTWMLWSTVVRSHLHHLHTYSHFTLITPFGSSQLLKPCCSETSPIDWR